MLVSTVQQSESAIRIHISGASQVALVVKNLLANAEDTGDADSVPGLGRSPRGGQGNLLQYFAWGILWTEEPGGLQSIGSQSPTWLKWLSLHTHTHPYPFFLGLSSQLGHREHWVGLPVLFNLKIRNKFYPGHPFEAGIINKIFPLSMSSAKTFMLQFSKRSSGIIFGLF